VSIGIALVFKLGAGYSGWSTPRPGRFAPKRRDRHPLQKRLRGPHCWSGRLQKFRPHRDTILGPPRP